RWRSIVKSAARALSKSSASLRAPCLYRGSSDQVRKGAQPSAALSVWPAARLTLSSLHNAQSTVTAKVNVKATKEHVVHFVQAIWVAAKSGQRRFGVQL